MRARRLTVVDEYLEDGRAAIYTSEGMVVLLSGVATSAWQLLDEHWTPVPEIVAALVREFGDPGGGRADELTADALRTLADNALVELAD